MFNSKSIREIVLGGVIVVALGTPSVASADTAPVSRAIVTEAINDYESYTPSCDWPAGTSLSNPIADANGFRNGMMNITTTTRLSGTSFYTLGTGYTDGDVWASDFADPERTRLADEDLYNFDKPDTAISYYSGHGISDTGDTSQYCTKAADCTNPPPFATSLAFCKRAPGDYFGGTASGMGGIGGCAYVKYSRQLAIGNCNGGPVPRHAVNYSTGDAGWGESSFAGTWGNAGVNGGTNMVVLHASNAEMSWRGGEVAAAFAGIHILATTLVHTGDTQMIADRGANFAAKYAANPRGSVAQAWAEALNSNADRNDWCQSQAGVSFGGGFGFNGCGAQNSSSKGATLTEADNHLNESWIALQLNTADGLGNAFWENELTCNYDCNIWPFGI